MKYNNIQQIQNDFDIKSNNVIEVRKKLLSIMSQYHPDKNNGDFKSDYEKNYFLKAKEGVEFIDLCNNQEESMVSMNDVKEIVKVISDIIPTKLEDGGQVLKNEIDRSIINYKVRNKIPKITTTTITALLTLIVAFPTQVVENPVLKKYINVQSDFFCMIWFESIIITILILVILKFKESRYDEFMRKLKIEDYQNMLFNKFLMTINQEFTKGDFVNYISDKRYFKTRNSALLLRSEVKIEMDVAYSLADIVFDRAESRMIIEKINSKSLTEIYNIIK